MRRGCDSLLCHCVLQKLPEEMAFAVLVKIMFDNRHRDLFKGSFEVLHLCLFQLGKLVEVCEEMGQAEGVCEGVRVSVFGSICTSNPSYASSVTSRISCMKCPCYSSFPPSCPSSRPPLCLPS